MSAIRARLTSWPAIVSLIFLIIPVGLLAAPGAGADPVADYAGNYGVAVCETLDKHPTFDGVMGVGVGVVRTSGFSYYDAGRVIGVSVAVFCPWHASLLREFIAVYGERPTFAV